MSSTEIFCVIWTVEGSVKCTDVRPTLAGQEYDGTLKSARDSREHKVAPRIVTDSSLIDFLYSVGGFFITPILERITFYDNTLQTMAPHHKQTVNEER